MSAGPSRFNGVSHSRIDQYKKDCALLKESCEVANERIQQQQSRAGRAGAGFKDQEGLVSQKENIKEFAKTIFTFYKQLNTRYQELTHDLADERAQVALNERKANRNPNQSHQMKMIDSYLKELSGANQAMQESVEKTRSVFAKFI